MLAGLERILYIILSVVFWMALTFTVGFEFNVGAWFTSFTTLIILSTLYALLFAFLFFGLLWASEKVFLAMLFAMLALEIFLFRNADFYHSPEFLYAIPLALVLYSLCTFAPLWIVERKISTHKWTLALMTAVYAIVLLLNYLKIDVV